MNTTLEQDRAKDALRCIKNVCDRSADQGSKYRSYVERLPAAIVMNGLGQAVATVMARANDKGAEAEAYRLLLEHVQGWLCRDHPAAPYRKKPRLIEAITDSEQSVYVRAHAEALAYLVWLKKFAQAFLERSKQSSHGESSHGE